MIGENLPRGALHAVDALSLTALVATISNSLPAIGALLTVVWTALRIYASILELTDRRRHRGHPVIPAAEAATAED